MSVAELNALSHEEANTKLLACYQKCNVMKDMLMNKMYDRDIIRPAVFQDDNSRKTEYPPVLPTWYYPTPHQAARVFVIHYTRTLHR